MYRALNLTKAVGQPTIHLEKILVFSLLIEEYYAGLSLHQVH